MLLINQEKGAVQLVARRVIDPWRGLAISRVMTWISCSAEFACTLDQIGFEPRVIRDERVERWIAKNEWIPIPL